MKKEDYNSDDTEKQEDILDQQNNNYGFDFNGTLKTIGRNSSLADNILECV